YLKTGKIEYYEEFRRKLPINLDELIAVEGMGPKKAKILYDQLGITNLAELEAAAREHKIAPLKGFGAKTEANILEGIEFLKKSTGRFLLGEVWPLAEQLLAALRSLPEVARADVAGSLRRKKETIGDLDFLVVSSQPDKVMAFFLSQPDVVKVHAHGPTKSSVRLRQGLDADLRVIPAASYGAALQYFSGSKEHNIALRQIAIDQGYKLNEYGLFDQQERCVAGLTEEEIYQTLGLAWVPPELREDRGELAAAREGRLPRLIDYGDIRGDLHVHSNWNGGAQSIAEIAQAALALGYEYVGIADHTKFLRIEHGLDEEQLLARNREIDALNAQFAREGQKFLILKGCEANILNDGSIDIADEVLAQLDYVIAGIHSAFRMPRQEMLQRLQTAMANPHVDIISHPTGRILKRREEYEVAVGDLLRLARETGTILEINAYPERLDLGDVNIRAAKEAGVRMVINTDAHHVDQLRYMPLGIAQARRGWAEKEDIVNAWPVDRLRQFFKR
ncbi:MAG: DNA polymerase/3'-5' exonuclease PolX, partial [Desulfobacca sp.]|uniref:DNA polymerase/3'-5' exonuclease PolX n=1 Tax=Desulfobacca sp. TaxID=2067990 RepID=UPI00404ADBB7